MTREDHIEIVESNRGSSSYVVVMDGGRSEIYFSKKTLAYRKAYFWDNDPGDEWYNSRELNQLREDHPGEFEYAAKLLSKTIGRNVPIPGATSRRSTKKKVVKSPTRKKTIRRK